MKEQCACKIIVNLKIRIKTYIFEHICSKTGKTDIVLKPVKGFNKEKN